MSLNRNAPLTRTARLEPGTPARRKPLARNARQRSSRAPLAAVSAKRARENRERAAMADRRWPDRREGTVMCAVWEAMQPDWCDRRASDLNEILPRGRSGSITEDGNTIPVCRPCNQELTKSPEWAYRLGFLKHDALCCQGRDACERYAEGGAA